LLLSLGIRDRDPPRTPRARRRRVPRWCPAGGPSAARTGAAGPGLPAWAPARGGRGSG